jgi:hypothetical protein
MPLRDVSRLSLDYMAAIVCHMTKFITTAAVRMSNPANNVNIVNVNLDKCL